MQNIVTEDSNSGYQFFSKIFSESNVVSANGNSNLIKAVKMLDNQDVLIIADGAAFGALIENCVDYFETQFNRRISLWLPESFEYLILKSGVIKYENLDDILENTSEYVECEKYVSWERFFTGLSAKISPIIWRVVMKMLIIRVYPMRIFPMK